VLKLKENLIMSRQIKNRVGETNITKSGLTVRIVSYDKLNNITIEFVDLGIIKNNVQYGAFKKGSIKAPMIFETNGSITKCTNPNIHFSFLIDTEDLPIVYDGWWCNHGDGYVSNGKKGLLHQIIMQPTKGTDVDHINGIPTDNRKENLRICTHAQNTRNKHYNTRNLSGYKGVSWHKREKKWRAQICYNQKVLFLGSFNNIHEAAKAYNQKAKELFKEFAYLNTIQEEN
jgi:hypothetical protein